MIIRISTPPHVAVLTAIFVSLVAISAVSCCCVKAMSVSVFYYCLCGFFCCCPCFNPSLCHLSPFLLSYVAVSRPYQCRYFAIVFVLFSVAVTVYNPSLCHLLPFLLSSVAVSRPCCLLEFYPNMGLITVKSGRERNFSHDTFIYPHLYQPNKIVGNQTKVKYYLLCLYISYYKTRLPGPSKTASLS